MSNVSKLDETIKELEEQTELLKENNKVLTKVTELSSLIEKGVTQLSIGNKNFDATKEEIQISLKALNELVSSVEKQNEKYIESLIIENKKFLREFSEDVSSKLIRFSSDIQVSIRQERVYLQEVLQNNITNQLNFLESKQKDLFTKQEKQISTNRILLIIIILLCVGLGIKSFI